MKADVGLVARPRRSSEPAPRRGRDRPPRCRRRRQILLAIRRPGPGCRDRARRAGSPAAGRAPSPLRLGPLDLGADDQQLQRGPALAGHGDDVAQRRAVEAGDHRDPAGQRRQRPLPRRIEQPVLLQRRPDPLQLRCCCGPSRSVTSNSVTVSRNSPFSSQMVGMPKTKTWVPSAGGGARPGWRGSSTSRRGSGTRRPCSVKYQCPL